VTVHPFHRLGGAEWQAAGQHLVQRRAQRIEIAARIDRAVHAPGLLGCHVRQRPGNQLRRLGRLALARQARGNAEARQPRSAARAVHQNVGRLDVLVQQAAVVQLSQCRCDGDGHAQETLKLHRGAKQTVQRHAARILQYQRAAPLKLCQRDRPDHTRAMELIAQGVLMAQASERHRRGLRERHDDQHGWR
jgi:hypothetical protein